VPGLEDYESIWSMHGRIEPGGKLMKRIALLAACILLASPAFAQSVGEKTGVNSALGITPKTADFVNEAATSDMFEIQSSKLAASRSTGDVQTFANQMVIDHTKTTGDLTSLAQGANIPLPTAMTSSQQST
jgi:putative membrane protein